MTSSVITLALTGASGAAYGLRLLEVLLASKCPVQLIVSDAARIVLDTEVDLALASEPAAVQEQLAQQLRADAGLLTVYGTKDWFSPVASGSSPATAMVVCPCSMGTLSAIAHGASNNLIERAADVMLKERRPLCLVPRETPFSPIHLENMAILSRAGATILPAAPGFYHKPTSVADLVDFVVARILDQLRIEHDLTPRWSKPA